MKPDQMMMIIQHLMKKVPSAVAVYGFGSFFRNEPFDDIDLVVILDAAEGELDASALALRRTFASASIELGVRFDITTLTVREFADKPLREKLVPVWRLAA